MVMRLYMDMESWLWIRFSKGRSNHSWLYKSHWEYNQRSFWRTANLTLQYWAFKRVLFPVKYIIKRSINFLASLQTRSSSTRVYKLPSVSLSYEDSSRSVKVNCFVASANICMLLSSLLYPCHSKCFFFSSVYRNGQATPPLSIHHNQIYSGLSTRLVGTICLRQTLRALVCHWPVSTNIILSSSILGCSAPLFS